LKLPGTETNLELIEYTNPTSERDPDMGKANQLGFRHIAFEVVDIDKIVQELKDKGIKFISSILTYPKTGKRLVYFWGPDEILLELAQY
jgi:catechol 2,3-dioxygenase-like lactoylglutathione lyase family enzyme